MAYEGEDLTNYQAGYEYLPQKQYSLDYTLPTTEEEVTETFGIPYTGAFTRSGVGGGQGGALQAGDINFNAFDRLATARQSKLDKGSKLSNAFYSIPGINKPQSYEDIMTHGYKEPGGAMPGIISLLNRFGVQNFASLPQADQAFIASQSGYRGPTIFGNNPGVGSQDPLGRNVESLFGNYAEAVRGDFSDLSTKLDPKEGIIGKKYNAAGDLEWDDELGEYTAGSEMKKANEMTKMLRSMWAYDRAAINKLEGIEGEVLEGQMFRDKIYGAEGRSDPQDKSRAGALGRRPGSGGTVDRVTEGPGQNVSDVDQQAYDSGGREGYGYGLKKGGRAGYRGGQLVRPGPGRPGYGGPHETYGGGVEAGRDPNPPDYSGGEGTVSHGGGDGITLDYITKDPSLTVNKSFLNDKANLQAKLYYDNLLENDDLKAEAQLKYGDATLSMDPNSNLNLGYNTNYKGTDITGSTNLQDTGSLMASKNGFYGKMTHNPEGTNFNVGWGTTFGGPEETYDAQSLNDIFVSPTVDEDIRLPIQYGGLVGIL